MVFLRNSLLFIGLAFLLTAGSCDKSTDPEKEVVQGDLFPLTAGHKFTFNGTLRDAVNDTNITATAAFYTGIMTVLPTAFTPALPPNVATIPGTTYFISDSSFVNPNPAIWVVSGFYVKRESETSGDIYFLTNAGRFYRQTGVTRPDSLKWIKLVQQNAEVGVTWEAFDSSYASDLTGTARLRIECTIEARADVSVNGTIYSAYKLNAYRKVFVGGSQTSASEGSTATIWLVPDVGIVKFIFNSDGETPGFERNLLSKNF